jgi:glycosyltransferase involved in cell wall biosynthesis
MSDFYSDLYVGGRLPFRRMALWLIQHLERMCVRADYLIVDTEAQRGRWMLRGADETKCAVIPHGLPRSWSQTNRAADQQLDAPVQSETNWTLFYVGDISEMDGVDVLMRAANLLRAHHPEVRLIIVGNGTNAYLRELHTLIGSLAIGDVVEHIVSVPNESLPAMIARVGVCVAPFRLQETSSTSIPNKVLEYLAGFKPIVVPSGSALEDTFGSALCYFVPDDPASLALAIETALSTAPQKRALRARLQHAMHWGSLMEREWALSDSIVAKRVGDAQRFDYRLRERLEVELRQDDS